MRMQQSEVMDTGEYKTIPESPETSPSLAVPSNSKTESHF